MPEEWLAALLPFAIAGPPKAGMAGGLEFLPFIGEIVPDLPCWIGAGIPPGTEGVVLLDAEDGENGFLVALA